MAQRSINPNSPSLSSSGPRIRLGLQYSTQLFGHSRRSKVPFRAHTHLAATEGSPQSSSSDTEAAPLIASSSPVTSNADKGKNPITGSGEQFPAEGLELAEKQPTLSVAAQIAATALLVSPFFFWGTSMVGMKMVAPHTSPLFVSAWRLLPAGGLLVAWGASRGRPQPRTSAAWGAIALFALVDATCFQGFLAEGLQRTSAGLGSVIIDSQPLTVAVLASLLFGESLSALGYAGLLLGIAGLLLLEIPQASLEAFLQNPDFSALKVGEGGSLWDSGEWWMLLSAQSMAVGTVMVRWVTKYCDPVMATGWHMVLGSLPLIALSAAQEGPDLTARLSGLTGLDAAILLYISVLGSAASYGVFFYNASRGNLTALSSLTFLTPMFAALGGYFVLGETLTPLQLTGAGITLGAVTLLNSKSSQASNEEE